MRDVVLVSAEELALLIIETITLVVIRVDRGLGGFVH